MSLVACGEKEDNLENDTEVEDSAVEVEEDYSAYCNEDPNQLLIADDEDCDGIPNDNDCDNDGPNSTTVDEDEDCDGTRTPSDCDDTDASSTIIATDGDCDGVLTDDDCNDSNSS